jgi:hypothetical protein
MFEHSNTVHGIIHISTGPLLYCIFCQECCDRLYLVVGFSSARSIAHAIVPLCSQPYASIPTVFPAQSRICFCWWIDLSKGNNPK